MPSSWHESPEDIYTYEFSGKLFLVLFVKRYMDMLDK